MIIFTSQGKIGIVDNGLSWLNSQFLASYQRNLQSIRQRTAWKTQGSGAKFMGVHQLHPQSNLPAYKANINGLTFASQGDLIYSISVDNGSGIFTKNPLDDKELEGHIIHKHDAQFFAIDYNSTTQQLVASVNDGMGVHLALFKEGSAIYTMLTEGDCRDQNPVWSKTKPESIFYDSCGIGTDRDGNFAGVSNRAIFHLDLNSGHLEEVVSLEKHDFLAPKEDSHGNLFFIKRPTPQKNHSRVSVLDVLLIPVKILKAIFNWLNFFTMRYSGNSLASPGANPANAKQKKPEEIFIDGNLINVQKTIKENKARGEKLPGVAPRNWELIRLDTVGNMTCIKPGILAFDIDDENNVIYSNGQYVVRMQADGSEEVLATTPLVTCLRAK